MPDSRPVAGARRRATMQLVEADLRTTGTNISGYSLFRGLLATLRSTPARRSAAAASSARCGRPGGAEIAQTPEACAPPIRAPAKTGSSTRKCRKRSCSTSARTDTELAVLEVDGLPTATSATEQGVKLEWPRYKTGIEHSQ